MREISRVRYDLNIYTRLCEILNIYIWGEMDKGREGERGKILKIV